MKLLGATIVVRFDATDKRLQAMMNPDHPCYRMIPKALRQLKERLNKWYDLIALFDFRYCYALEQFELMGVIASFEEAVEAVMEIEEALRTLGYPCHIRVGFGEVCFPKENLYKSPMDLLHTILGEGVYAAFGYDKLQEKPTGPIYFGAKAFDISFANTHSPWSEKDKKRLRDFLQTQQKMLSGH